MLADIWKNFSAREYSILVVKATVTKRVALKRVIEQIQQVKANLVGIVLDDVKVSHSRYYYYRGYEYHPEHHRAGRRRGRHRPERTSSDCLEAQGADL